jgi:hypothetical protein
MFDRVLSAVGSCTVFGVLGEAVILAASDQTIGGWVKRGTMLVADGDGA